MALKTSSRARLTPLLVDQFPGETLFDRLGRAACESSSVPRKELYEGWEVARRVRRRFRGGRVIDLAAGMGLVGPMMLLLDRTSTEAICVDMRRPQNNPKLWDSLTRHWPQFATQLRYVEAKLDAVALKPDDVIVSVHACGSLTDHVLSRALEARCRVAVLPCCHDLDRNDLGGLRGWVDGPLAVDLTRAARMRAAGWSVHTMEIPATITPKNRLLMASPPE